jgi:serine protease AprX
MLGALLAGVLALCSLASVTSGPAPDASVIVQAAPEALTTAEQAVRRVGGSVGRSLPIVNGFVADVPADEIDDLASAPGVASVSPNRTMRPTALLDGWDHTHDFGSMYYVAQEVSGAAEFWNNGLTGRGVDVAVIDSGVAPVNGLRTRGKLLHGPDFSFESQNPQLRYLDTFGHGTHMAGIIAGRDDATSSAVQKGEETFVGVAPDARIVSLKVADQTGATDVSQVLAAIDWVVQHRNTDGLNIRDLNLSFGTDGVQDYRVDPLAYAVEQAWREGIVVVVAAGNGGYGSRQLNNPAYDPFVIAVGAADGMGTYDWKDDVVPTWSSWGDGTRNPDLVAPGKSVVSLRVPGSYLDRAYPGGRVGATPRFFRGSGTSQAAAVVSGAAALIIQQRPRITPDQVKHLLRGTAHKLWKADLRGQGAGMIDLKVLRDKVTPSTSTAAQAFTFSSGSGSLESARGTNHVTERSSVLTGERDIFGTTWFGSSWARGLAAGTGWNGGLWRGNTWTGNTWTGNTWTAATWTARTWSGSTWSGNTWSGNTWSGNTWSGNTWTGNTWSGNTWTGNTWSGNTWSGAVWGR